MKLTSFLKEFIEMTKPKVWIFLLITGVAGLLFAMAIIKKINPFDMIYVILYLAFGLMGSESLSNYIDMDIDKKMKRTMHRALPAGRLKPSTALIGGLILVAVTLIMSYRQSFLSFIFMFTGIIDYVIIYALLTKRRTWLNIILGAYSGGAPLLAGYTALTNHFNFIIISWFFIIIIWTPLHIWALSVKYRDDYKNAGVPMLPVIIPIEKTVRVLFIVALGTALITVFSAIVSLDFFHKYLGYLDLAISILMSTFIIIAYFKASGNPEKNIMNLFIVSNIFIGFFFLMVSVISLIILISP